MPSQEPLEERLKRLGEQAKELPNGEELTSLRQQITDLQNQLNQVQASQTSSYDKPAVSHPGTHVAEQRRLQEQQRREEEKREEIEEEKENIYDQLSHYKNRLEDIQEDLDSFVDDAKERANEADWLSCCQGTINRYIAEAEDGIRTIEREGIRGLDREMQRLGNATTMSTLDSFRGYAEEFRIGLNKIIGIYNGLVRDWNNEHFVESGEWAGVLHGHKC